MAEIRVISSNIERLENFPLAMEELPYIALSTLVKNAEVSGILSRQPISVAAKYYDLANRLRQVVLRLIDHTVFTCVDPKGYVFSIDFDGRGIYTHLRSTSTDLVCSTTRSKPVWTNHRKINYEFAKATLLTSLKDDCELTKMYIHVLNRFKEQVEHLHNWELYLSDYEGEKEILIHGLIADYHYTVKIRIK